MNTENAVRLNKYLSESGICSRREADRLIASEKVEVNGQVAKLGSRIWESDQVKVNGNLISKEEEEIILAFYKPRGVVCTSEKREKDNIIDYVAYPKRITYAGRLDKDSEGLVILTNQGELVDQMMRAVNKHEKEYRVTVNKPVTGEFLKIMKEGIWLEELGVRTRECKVKKLSEKTFTIILTQGLNRQIRRMCQLCGYHVRKLVRVRIMNIKLNDLEKGTYRNLTEGERIRLYQLLGKGF